MENASASHRGGATIHGIAGDIETFYEWDEIAAQRIRFIRDFGCVIRLHVSELASAALGDVRVDERCGTFAQHAFRLRNRARHSHVLDFR